MLHQTINSTLSWQKIHDFYSSEYVDNQEGRFLVRKNRSGAKYLNELSRAYQTAQRQYSDWREKNFNPIFDTLISLAVDGKIICHAKPTHKYEMYRNHDWWEYSISDTPKMGWGWSFNWIPEPEEKIHHELGQKLYELDQKSKKYSRRRYILELVLKDELEKYLLSIYGYKWLDENQYKEDKLVKINLRGDQFWYRISRNRNGVPVWENFIWQSNKTEEINL